MGQRIAIVGAGVAGLTAGYLLNHHHEITLFEKTDRLGGNAWTYKSRSGHEVDIGVAVYSRSRYKLFFKLISRLKLKTKRCIRAYLSLHNLDTQEGFYLTPGMKGLFAQRFRLLKPTQMKELFRVIKAVKVAIRMLDAGDFEGLTLREALKKVPHMTGNTRLLILCAWCLISSMSCEEVLDGPAEFFMEKIKRHHELLSPKVTYALVTMKHRSKSYVEALSAGYRDKVVFNSDIKTVVRKDDKIQVVLGSGETRVFDKIVFACNADQILALLDSPTPAEEKLLGPWKFKESSMVVHQDHSSFPKKALIQAFTFLYTERNGVMNTSVNGCTWYLPGVSRKCDVISSQHSNFPIDPELIEHVAQMRIPLFDFQSCATIKQLPSLNGVMNSYYCGSYFGFGLHEDAVNSAAEVAKHLGVDFWDPARNSGNSG